MGHKENWDVIIIGGGAAGLAAAIAAAEMGDRVLVLEKMDRVGKKIMATGNGRCNILNTGEPTYFSGRDLAEAVLQAVPAKLQWAWWKAHGLSLREEEGGRAYPVSGHASSVVDVLRLWLQKCNVQVETGMTVTKISQKNGDFIVHAVDKTGADHVWAVKRAILTTGGMAQPKLGSDGSGYALAESMGHTIIKPKPALSQIETEKAPIAGLSGVRIKASIEVVRAGKRVFQEAGELLFTEYGVSGVCAMQCAQAASAPNTTLEISFTAGLGFSSEQQLQEELFRRRKLFDALPLESLLAGICVPSITLAVFRRIGLKWQGRAAGSLTNQEIRQTAAMLQRFPLAVKGIRGFDTCQVTSGGVRCDEISPDTMASTLVEGLYLAGEVLDVDGDCGGHNLMFAFGSGLLAGYNGRMKWNGALAT